MSESVMKTPRGAPLSIAQALQHARQQGIDRLDAQMLLEALLGRGHSWLIAHDQDALPASVQASFLSSLQRRAQGEPLAYILGDKAFFGLTLAVSPDVLIPRPDTETLVAWALERIDTAQPPAPLAPAAPVLQVLDLGTGSGAIALAIRHHRPSVQVTAVDASDKALGMARLNAQRLGLPVGFLLGHWLTPVANQRFDLIVSNPPYIAEDDPHMAALHHEPRQALTAGEDGLDDIRQIVAQAPPHLHTGGWLLLEHGYNQAVAVAQLLSDAGFSNVSTRFDLGGQPRCTGGQIAR